MVTATKLSERAMLIHVSCHGWTGRKKDRLASEDVCTRAKAAKEAVDVIAKLVPKKKLDPIYHAKGRIDRKVEEMTLPWLTGGYNILPSDLFMSFRTEITKLIRGYTEAVNDLVKQWPSIVAAAPNRLGTLLSSKQIHLPTAAEVKAKFFVTFDVLPIPEVSDFRAKMREDEFQSVRQEVDASWQRLTTKALQEVWLRLADLVGKLGERMAEKDTKFRDSIVGNLKNFCELMPKFNLTNNADLEKIRREVMNGLASLDPEDLREIPNHRKKAAKDAQDILAKIGQYIPV